MGDESHAKVRASSKSRRVSRGRHPSRSRRPSKRRSRAPRRRASTTSPRERHGSRSKRSSPKVSSSSAKSRRKSSSLLEPIGNEDSTDLESSAERRRSALARTPQAYRGDPTNSPRTKAAGTECPSPDGRNKDLFKRIIEKQSHAAEVAPMPPPAPDATDLANAPGSAGHLAIEDGFAEGTDWEHLRDGTDRKLGRSRAAAEGGSASSSSSQTPTMNKDAHDVACEQNSDSPPSKRIRRGIGVDSMRGSPVAFRRWLEVMCQSG